MNIELLETEQNFQNETTIVWFEVDGVMGARKYGVCFESQPTHGYSFESEATGYHAKLLDSDGCPEIVERSEGWHIWNAILPLAEKEIN